MTKKDLREKFMSPEAIKEMDQRIKLKKIEERVTKKINLIHLNELCDKMYKLFNPKEYRNYTKSCVYYNK
jgi:hypothetical protein